ncbi:MAG: choice-of-anchor Q domain-containing protein, partial [Lysobacterales bacterium]
MTRYALSVCLLALLAWSAPALAFDIDRYVTMDGEDTGNCATLGQACRTPRYALSVSNAGDVIYIHHGEYAQHLIIDRNITLRGGGPGMTTLLGPGGVTALERVITVDGAYQVRIEGLSIKDGAAHAANGLFDGGGIYSTASHLTLNNVRVEDNRSTRHGGGIYHGVGQLFLINTVITGNHLALYGSPVLTWGGGLYLASGQAVIVNSTLVGNMADQGGGLVVRPDANAWLMNSIVWQNISWDDIGHEIHQEGQTGLMIQHSIFRDRPAESDVVGSGIIVDAASLNEDPDWLSSDYPHDRDYRLRPMSPAINAGLNTFYAQAGGDPATDLDHGGDWRVWNHANGGAIDIGAYEFQGEPADLAPPVLQLPAYNAINVARPTGLVWRSVPLADSYQVQVTVASDNIAMAFSDPVIDVTLSDTRFRAEDLDALRDYDWRVRAVMNGFVGEWSPPWRFTTQGTLQTGAGNILHITSSSRGDATGRNWYNAHGSLANALKWAAFNEGRGLWDSDNPLQIWVASGFHRPAHRPEDLLEMPILSSQA